MIFSVKDKYGDVSDLDTESSSSESEDENAEVRIRVELIFKSIYSILNGNLY